MNAVNESTGGLLTPLLETLRLEKTEFAWTLICQGANLKALDAAQQSVLHYLAKYPDGLRLMVQPGLEPLFLEILNHRSGPFHFQRTPLLEALHCQNLHAALWLLRKGAGVAHLDAVHESCFHYAARLTENRGIMFLKQVFSVAPKEFTDLLLHHVPSASGRTCLLEALRFNNIEVALALIEKGARLDVRDIWGGDLLSYLFRLSDLDSARVLEQVIRLNRTSEIDTAQLEKVSLGHTPVLRALREGRSGLFTRLIISGADIDVSVVGTRQSVRAFYESLGETNSAKSTLKSIIEKGSAEFLRRREELNQQKQAEALGSPMPKAALLLSNKKAEPASHAPEKGSPGLPA